MPEESLYCPNCKGRCWRESVDVGVGIIYGPWNCSCGWTEDDSRPQVQISGTCIVCKEKVEFYVSQDSHRAWKAGAHIQEAMPEVSPGHREFLISKTCETCFDRITNPPGEDE